MSSATLPPYMLYYGTDAPPPAQIALRAGSLSLIDVRSDYRVQIPEGDWTTLGGYAFAKLGRLPRMGDRIPSPGGEMEVVAMDGRRIAALRIHRAGVRQPAVAAAHSA